MRRLCTCAPEANIEGTSGTGLTEHARPGRTRRSFSASAAARVPASSRSVLATIVAA